MLETIFNSVVLLLLSAALSFAALSLWALRVGTREAILAVFVLFTLMCLLPYLVVPVVTYLAEVGVSTATPYLIVMAVGQAAGVVAAFYLRRRPASAPLAA